MDRLISSLMGRSLALGDEEYDFAASPTAMLLTTEFRIDIDLPTECDDEYWEAADPGPGVQTASWKTFCDIVLQLLPQAQSIVNLLLAHNRTRIFFYR